MDEKKQNRTVTIFDETTTTIPFALRTREQPPEYPVYMMTNNTGVVYIADSCVEKSGESSQKIPNIFFLGSSALISYCPYCISYTVSYWFKSTFSPGPQGKVWHVSVYPCKENTRSST